MYSVKDPEAFDAKPELGMGYHFGVVQTSQAKVGSQEGVIVLNAKYALTPREIMDFDSLDRLLLGHELPSGIVITIISAPPLAPERDIVPSDEYFFVQVVVRTSHFELELLRNAAQTSCFPCVSVVHEGRGSIRALFGISERSQNKAGWKLAAGYLCNK
jgi:hypothetical protein